MAIPEQAAPQPVQSNDEAISSFASGFLADLEKNPDADAPRDGEVEPQEPESPEPVDQEAETPTPEPQEPMVEVELDGKKANIPEWVKHRVMADKDYRQKTMEIAATRKNLESLTATATQLAQQAQQMAPYYAQLNQMDSRAQQLQQTMQQARANQDPLAFNEAQGELAILLHGRDQFAQGLQQWGSQLTQQQQAIAQQKLALDVPALLQEVPEFSKPETRQAVSKYAVESGLPQDALEYLNFSAPGAKLVWKAMQYDAMKASETANRAKLKESTKTLPAASQSSRAVDTSAKSKTLQENWQRRGGKINDPAFGELLRNKIRGK